MEKVKIIFADGTEVNAERNGDCLILKKRTTLPTDLSVVTVRGDDGDTVYHNAELTESASVDGRYWFAFTEIPEDVREIRQLRADNDMLTECILEMSEIIYGE